jgi:DUF4097 and DUF4098 domain-containing protein YvlB
MYKILFLLLVIIPSIAGKGQRLINKELDWTPGQEMNLELSIIDSIKVEAWTRNTISLEISVNIDNNSHNDWYNLEVSESKGTLSIESSFAKKKSLTADIHAVLKLPRDCHLSIKTINGNVEITGHNAPLNIETISGLIDLAVDAQRSIHFRINSISGKVFTDLKLQEKDSNGTIVGTDIDASVNGGKETVELKTISGNIYIRKE